MENDKQNTKSEETKLKRRDFLSQTIKGIAAASLPLIAGAKSCKEHKTTQCDLTQNHDTSAVEDGERFDIIVIGSGFGATVAVTQLLNKKKDLKLLILERGLWWQSPDKDKPSYLNDKPVQYFTKPDHREGVRYMLSIFDSNITGLSPRANPLYKHHSFKDIDVLTASGVGGGSLIYLNVTVPPIWDEKGGNYPILDNWDLKLIPNDYSAAIDWMSKWRGKLNHIVTEFPLMHGNPADLAGREYLYFGKTRAFKQSSDVTSANWKQITKWTPAPLSIHEYEEAPNLIGKELGVCTRQGRCFLGCPPGAIQTLDKTLLKDFLSDPVKYPNLSLEGLREVTHIEALADGSFKVWFYDKSASREKRHYYYARKVILAAGTLGSNEILLRSKYEKSLSLSRTLGVGFSGNGDLGGFVKGVNLGYKVYPTRGPLITSLAQYQSPPSVSGGLPIHMTVEDGGIPPTLAYFTRLLLNIFDPAKQVKGFSTTDWLETITKFASSDRIPQELTRLLGLPNPCDRGSFPSEHQMLENYFYFQCMGKDEANGRFDLDAKGRLDLQFPSPPQSQPVFKYLEEIMGKIAWRMGGEFIKFPTMLLPRPKLFTLHPLGGCAIGKDASKGVVNIEGRVFKVAPGANEDTKVVYENLYVIDASIFPGSVAVNPTLTIVALALKIAEKITV